MSVNVDIVKYGWQKRGSFIIDDLDYERVIKYKWSKNGGTIKNNEGVSIKRFIMNVGKGSFHIGVHVVYKNGNKLDNRRSNLIIVKAGKRMSLK